MGREPGLDEREGARQAGRAGIPLGWRPSEETSDVAHFLRLTKRYPDLASGIQRSIGLARDERQRRPRHPAGVSPPPPTAWKADMGITIVQKSDLTVRKRDP